MSINRVVITGNLTRDPELRTTASGTSVLSIGVAVNDRRRNPQTGNWEDYPNYVDCTIFGKRAESLSNILHKGSKVAIAGRLRWSSWKAKDGSNRSKLEVIADDVDFMSSRNNGGGYANNGGSNYGGNTQYGGGYQQNNAAQPAQPSVPMQNSPAPADDDSAYGDEIPF
jgi:single-strand DNA-binding protein